VSKQKSLVNKISFIFVFAPMIPKIDFSKKKIFTKSKFMFENGRPALLTKSEEVWFSWSIEISGRFLFQNFRIIKIETWFLRSIQGPFLFCHFFRLIFTLMPTWFYFSFHHYQFRSFLKQKTFLFFDMWKCFEMSICINFFKMFWDRYLERAFSTKLPILDLHFISLYFGGILKSHFLR